MTFTSLLAAATLLILPSARAVTPQHVVLDTYADFAEGESVSTSLSDTGIVTPAPDVRKIGDVDAGQIWSVLPQPDGTILAGTSPDGKLLRIDSSGKSTLLTRFAESHIYTIARNAAGDVFVATSPDGKIFKLNPGKKPTVYFEPGEKYIWHLLFGKDGALYAATGTRGRIYRITGESRGELYYDSDETHIRTLAFDREGRLLAGSADNGYLYRVTRRNEGIVLYASGRQEVNCIAVSPAGLIFFSAVGSTKSTGTGTSGTSGSPAGLAGLRALLSAGSGDSDGPGSSSKSGGTPGSGSGKTKGGTKSQVFRIDDSLNTTEIWHTNDTVFTLDHRNGKIYAGTSGDGYLYALTERGEATRLLKVGADSLSAAALTGDDRFILATSNPARVFAAGGPRRSPGVYESDVIDSESFARWGSVNLKAIGPVTVRTRSGNTPKPDKSWYEWTALKGDQSQSPAARYLQVELRLQEGEVDRVDVVFLPKNAAPHIARLEALAPGVGYLAIVPPPQPLPSKTADQLLANAGRSELELLLPLSTRFQPTLARGLRTIVWKASDPNDDELIYTIHQRSDSASQWRLLAKEYKDAVLSWDSSGWPDGNYQLKVTASDSPSNAPPEALTDEMVTRVVTVDNSPPVITILGATGGKARFRVADSASILASVQISKDGKEFTPLQPVDGILDSRSEEFETGLGPGEVLFIRAEDEFGNVKGDLIPSPEAAPLKK